MLSAQDRCLKFPDGSEGVQGLYLFSLESVIRSARKTRDDSPATIPTASFRFVTGEELLKQWE